MKTLRMVLYLEAALFAVTGTLLALVPGWVLETVVGLPGTSDHIWIRATGILAFTVALLMVLVAQNAEQAWFWTWAFIFAQGNLALLFLLKALFGFTEPEWFWWAGAAAGAVMTGLLLLGVARAYPEAPDR